MKVKKGKAHKSSLTVIGALLCLVLIVGALPVRAATLKSVQSGTTTIPVNSNSQTVTITSVDTTKAFLVFSVTTDEAKPNISEVRGQITNATTLTFNRSVINNTPVAKIAWYVAEFTSGVSVQRGSVAMDVTTKNVTITGVTTSRSFPIISYESKSGNYDATVFIKAKITSSTNLEISNQQADANATVEWQVVDFTGASVQTGDIAFANGDSSKTATLSPSITTSNSWLIYTYNSVTGTKDDNSQKFTRGLITNSTTLTFDRANTGQSMNLTWYLVEFTDGTTVQQGSQNFTSSDTQKNVTITSVSTTKSLAAGGYFMRGGKTPYTATGNPGVVYFTLELTSSTNLQITRAITGSATADIGWYVVTFNSTLSLVKRAFLSDGTAIADTSTLPKGTIVKFLLYIDNKGAATNDVSIRDTLAATFAYQTGTIKTDNSVANCAATTCTAGEESSIFTAVDATAAKTDAVDGDVASQSGSNIDAGNQNVANAQLNISASKVFALLFTAKMQ